MSSNKSVFRVSVLASETKGMKNKAQLSTSEHVRIKWIDKRLYIIGRRNKK